MISTRAKKTQAAEITEQMIKAAAMALWDDGARYDPPYQFPSRKARYRAAKAAVTAALKAAARANHDPR
jgi:hypothetical protein